MDEELRKQIAALARHEKRLPKRELRRFDAAAKDRYAFERGWYEHALEPHWGIAPPMLAVVRYVGADRDAVVGMIRAELGDVDPGAREVLEAG